MKKFLIGAIAAMTLTFACGTAYGKTEVINNLYPITGKVVGMDYTADTVTVEQANGNLWSFIGCDDWQLNDTCNMIMNTNGTANIYDDHIVSVRYSVD